MKAKTTILVAILLVAAVGIGFMLVPTSANAGPSSTTTANTWVTNGTVNAIANANGLTYIGGIFNQVGPAGGAMEDSKGKGGPVDPTTGEPGPRWQHFACGFGAVSPVLFFGFLMGLTSLASLSWSRRRSRRSRRKRV